MAPFMSFPLVQSHTSRFLDLYYLSHGRLNDAQRQYSKRNPFYKTTLPLLYVLTWRNILHSFSSFFLFLISFAMFAIKRAHSLTRRAITLPNLIVGWKMCHRTFFMLFRPVWPLFFFIDQFGLFDLMKLMYFFFKKIAAFWHGHKEIIGITTMPSIDVLFLRL